MGCQRRRFVFIDFPTRTHPHPLPRLLFFICRYLLFDFSDSKHIPIQSLFIKCNWLRFLSIPSKLYPPARCRNFVSHSIRSYSPTIYVCHRNWPISIQLFVHTNSGYQFPSSATSRLQLLQIDIESYYYYPPRGNGQIYPLETMLQLLGDTHWIVKGRKSGKEFRIQKYGDTTTTITSKLLGVNL